MNTIPPPAESAHQDNVLMAEVTTVNTQLGRYVLDFLDADTGQRDPLPVADERALADRVSALANGIRARAERREQEGDVVPLIQLPSSDEQP